MFDGRLIMNASMLFNQISVTASNLSMFTDKDGSSVEHKEQQHLREAGDLGLVQVHSTVDTSHLHSELSEEYEDRDEDEDDEESPVSSSDEMVMESSSLHADSDRHDRPSSMICGRLNGDGSRESDAAGSSSEQGNMESWNKMIHRGLSGIQGGQDVSSDPLAQLQSALERNGMLGMKLEPEPRQIPQTGHGISLATLEASRAVVSYGEPDTIDVTGEIFRCHLCTYTGSSRFHFNSHMNTHFDHKCPYCDYTSRTEGRLKRHVKDFHSEAPNSSEPWKCTSDDPEDQDEKGTKPRMHKCKQCNYVALNKGDFWEHSKGHIKKEKLLNCPNCPFVTEYKHHLEYHLRNHYGSKPFKCNKCNYKCVNKSMLNSHMKSHSNIYQYRCADCNYATKYCHSLKLHLRKYNHKPGPVLNLDGTPNPYPIIDVNGTRRGPRPKKPKTIDDQARASVSISMAMMNFREQNVTASLHLPTIIPTSMSSTPYLYPPPPVLNGFPKGLFMQPPKFEAVSPTSNSSECISSRGGQPVVNFLNTGLPFKCNLCEFSTETKEHFSKHMLQHATSDNQDLCKLYGISPDVLMHSQELPNSLPSQSASSQISAGPSYSSVSSMSNSRVDLPPEKDSRLPEAKLEHSSVDSIKMVDNNQQNLEVFKKSSSVTLPSSVSSYTSVESSGSHQESTPPCDYTSVPIPTSECSVIVSSQSNTLTEKVNPSPLSNTSRKLLSTSDHNPNPGGTEDKPSSTTPLDLSSSNRNSPSGICVVSCQSITPSTVSPVLSSPPVLPSEGTQGPGSPPRNRRKGKAFKLDQIRLRSLQESSHVMDSNKQETDEESVDNPSEGGAYPVERTEKSAESLSAQTVQSAFTAGAPNDPGSVPSSSASSSLPVLPPQTDAHLISKSGGLPQNPSAIIPSILAAKIQAEVEDCMSRCTINNFTAQLAQQMPSPQSSVTISPYLAPSSIQGQPVLSMASPKSRSNFLPSTTHTTTSMFPHSSMRPFHPEVPCAPLGSHANIREPVPQQYTHPKQGAASPHRTTKGTEQEVIDKPCNNTAAPVKSKDVVGGSKWQDAYTCMYCEMAFKDCVMYTMHMGYHGYQDPFTCNMCGQSNSDKVSFFLHIARVSHV